MDKYHVNGRIPGQKNGSIKKTKDFPSMLLKETDSLAMRLRNSTVQFVTDLDVCFCKVKSWCVIKRGFGGFCK